MNKSTCRRWMAVVIFGAGSLLSCVAEEEPFPDQIPAIVQTLGVFHRAINDDAATMLDSVSLDPELYNDLTHVLAGDSLAVLTRRIQNPVDSAHVTMTVAVVERSSGESRDRYLLELYLSRRGDLFWIVAHRLTHSPQ